MSSSYRLELDRFLAQLDVRALRVIDVGGSQLPVKGRTKSWEVSDYLIADLPTPHKNSPSPDLDVDLNKLAHQTSIMADLVFCLEVFDYVFLPDIALNHIYDFLAPDGIAWVTFPFIYPTHQPVEQEGLRYTENSIKRLAEYVGLEIDEVIRRKPETNMLDRLFRAERMRAAKGYDHEVTGWIVKFRRPE